MLILRPAPAPRRGRQDQRVRRGRQGCRGRRGCAPLSSGAPWRNPRCGARPAPSRPRGADCPRRVEGRLRPAASARPRPPGRVELVMSPQLALCEVSSHESSSGGFCRAELAWRELSSHRASRTQRAPVRLTPPRHRAPAPELARRRIMSSSSFSSPRPRGSPTTPARPFTSAPRTRNRRPGAPRPRALPGPRDRRVTAEIAG